MAEETIIRAATAPPAPPSIKALVIRLLSQSPDAEQIMSHLQAYREGRGLPENVTMHLDVEVTLSVEIPELAPADAGGQEDHEPGDS